MKVARKIALTAMFSALGTVFLFLTGIWPFGTVALLCAASAFVAFSVMECGMGYGLLSYITISVLGFLLVPDKTITLWEFVLLLGYYPVIKCLIERLNRLWLEWLIKVLFFSVMVIVLLLLFQFVLFIPIVTELPVWLYGIGGIALLAVYDYALSVFLSYYRNRLKGKLRKNS
jgi:hypothetical protein